MDCKDVVWYEKWSEKGEKRVEQRDNGRETVRHGIMAADDTS